MVAMLNSLRWRRPSHWNLLVYDRSALFDVLKRQCHPFAGFSKSGNAALESRIFHILQEAKVAWTGLAEKPAWKIQQEEMQL